jgi:hypothetical protein
VIAAYKVAAARKREGDDIGIYSHTNRSNIKVVGKAFKGEVVIKQVLDC